MPDPTGGTELESINIRAISAVAESGQSLSFASCPTCSGPNRTPIEHAKCAPVDVFAGKGILTDGELVGAGDLMGKVNSPSSSSSAPHLAENNKARSWVTGYPLASYGKFYGVRLEPESGNDQPGTTRTVRGARPQIRQGSYPFASLYPKFSVQLQPATRTRAAQPQRQSQSREKKLQTSRNTEPAVDSRNHGPASPSTNTNGVSNANLISVTERAANEDYWQDREQKIFRDLSGSSPDRFGICMQIQAENWDGEPEHMMDGAALHIPRFASAATPGFTYDVLACGIIPFTDERLIDDPDRVGLERLNVLSRRVSFAERPPFRDQDQI